ncbi:asparagine synthase (glutamine-hydrolyzing) [Ferruginibacter sp. SUN002]|uniref:asparagine synthase (glutamine-hydrolyzing) n=1 Tax=Ferruginibacter sp. SUN002 TaxID=2937789 RepID=UPI003D35D687
MCRIAGIINPSATPETLQSMVREMCRLQKHGGPDDEGVFSSFEHGLALGHRRLSIIDLSQTGHQPMSFADGRSHISYNGEIYNYLELKQELKKLGCMFNTHSDTEVILAAFSTWGTAAFSKLNGMFAFALFDQKNGELFLVRDAGGIKPLYYAVTKQGLAFASEVRGFQSVPYLQTKGSHWQVYLMAYRHLPEPITTLEDVKPLQKGSYLKYTISTGKYNIETFLTYKYVESISNRATAIELITDGLQNAVKRHLIADAPIGVFLSGGLDSSIIASVANDDKKVDLNTVSIFFNEAAYSEKEFQDLLQSNLAANNFQYLLNEKDFHENLPAIINSMDMPSCDGINTWFISKFAKESGLKAVLSGIGGDELFGGYPSFGRIDPTLLLKKLPDLLLTSGRYTGFRRMKRLQYLTIDGPVGMYLFLRGQFVPSEIARELNANESEIWEILRTDPQLPGINDLSAKNQASWMEMNMYMQNQLLRDADVMSMAHGVEIRVPFLDKDFVELALKIRSDIKYSGKYGKQILIDAFGSRIPQQVWQRPKMGFAFPFTEWFIDNDYAKQYSKNHKKLKEGKMHWSQFLTLLLIENNVKA